MRHQSKYVVPAVTLLALACFGRQAQAQPQTITLSQTSYDSLTDVAGNVIGTQDVTGTNPFVSGNGLARTTKNGSDQGAFALQYGLNVASRGSVSDLGNGTLSTNIVTDDLTLQVARPFAGANLSSFSLTSTRFLLTNENDTSVDVSAHIRFYEDDGVRASTGTGGFAGTLLAQYDLNPTTLLGRGNNFASATQIELTAADFAATPLVFSSGSFTLNTLNQYENRIWVGVFLTANSATTSVTQLNNIGLTVYDNDLLADNPDGTNADGSRANGGSTQFTVGRSDNQFYGDDNTTTFDGARENSPYNYNLRDANGFTYFTDSNTGANNQPDINPGANAGANPANTFGLFAASRLDGVRGDGPDANLTWLIQGNATYTIPEPGTIGLLFMGALPCMGVVAARRRRVLRDIN